MRQRVFVFVGCGGTFWTASPTLAALTKKYQPQKCFFVDPDVLEERNLERQWVLAQPFDTKANIGRKAIVGAEMRATIEGKSCLQLFSEWLQEHRGELADKDVVFIVNVDNDDARLEIRDYCRLLHRGTAIMVMSGCDVNYGQVYTGWWEEQRPHHDWAESHPDIQRNKPPGDRCGQNIFSNSMTGAFLGAAMHHVCGHLELEEKPEVMLEWYWRRGENDYIIKSWTDEVVPTGMAGVVGAMQPLPQEIVAMQPVLMGAGLNGEVLQTG